MRAPRTVIALIVLCAITLAACDGLVKDLFNGTLDERIDTVTVCFPTLMDKAGHVLDVVEAWRVSDAGAVGDPPALTSTISAGNDSLDVSYAVATCTIAMTVTFHAPDGTAEAIPFSGEGTLAEQIETAAATLVSRHGDDGAYLLGRWNLTSDPVDFTGSGAFVGVLGADPTQLVRVMTVNDTVTAVAPGVISSSGGVGPCGLRFRLNSLVTDTDGSQVYPIGTVGIGLDGAASVEGLLAFDGTSTAVLSIGGVPGDFDWDLDSGDLTYNRR